MKEEFIYQEEQLSFFRKGEGDKTIFMFHGFGQDGTAFDTLISHYVNSGYRVFSFDLFFHGGSVWSFKKKYLDPHFLKEMFEQFLATYDIERFSLLGFSLGGRYALSLSDTLPHKVDELVLLAPDGIKTSFWYRLVTYRGVMRSLFRRTIEKPGLYFGLTRFFRALRLVDKGIVRFANGEMNTKEKRARVYNSWVVFSRLNSSLSFLKHQPDRVKIFTGRYDRIMKTTSINGVLSKHTSLRVHELNCGHNGVIRKLAEEFSD